MKPNQTDASSLFFHLPFLLSSTRSSPRLQLSLSLSPLGPPFFPSPSLSSFTSPPSFSFHPPRRSSSTFSHVLPSILFRRRQTSSSHRHLGSHTSCLDLFLPFGYSFPFNTSKLVAPSSCSFLLFLFLSLLQHQLLPHLGLDLSLFPSLHPGLRKSTLLLLASTEQEHREKTSSSDGRLPSVGNLLPWWTSFEWKRSSAFDLFAFVEEQQRFDEAFLRRRREIGG